jgi:hypothetical protein
MKGPARRSSSAAPASPAGQADPVLGVAKLLCLGPKVIDELRILLRLAAPLEDPLPVRRRKNLLKVRRSPRAARAA